MLKAILTKYLAPYRGTLMALVALQFLASIAGLYLPRLSNAGAGCADGWTGGLRTVDELNQKWVAQIVPPRIECLHRALVGQGI